MLYPTKTNRYSSIKVAYILKNEGVYTLKADNTTGEINVIKRKDSHHKRKNVHLERKNSHTAKPFSPTQEKSPENDRKLTGNAK